MCIRDSCAPTCRRRASRVSPRSASCVCCTPATRGCPLPPENQVSSYDEAKQGEADTTLLSRLFIYYNERVMEGTVGTDSGAMIRDGIKTVNAVGACPESEWPYDIARFTEKPVSYTHLTLPTKRIV